MGCLPDLDRFSAEPSHAVHGGHGRLLLHLVAEPDEAEPLAEARLVQDHWKDDS